MLWLVALIVVAFAIALIAFAGVRIKGARQVGNTHLMTAARLFVIILLMIVALYSFGWLR